MDAHNTMGQSDLHSKGQAGGKYHMNNVQPLAPLGLERVENMTDTRRIMLGVAKPEAAAPAHA
jgi:hypothetical protein